MILIDPELELSRAADALNPVSAKPSAGPAAAPGRKLPAKPSRLPSTPTLARTLAQFLTRAQAAVPLRGQVTVLLTSDATMRDLNRRFRGKNKPTDVLSFPIENLVQDQKKNQEKGDVAISVETARRQSAEQGHLLTTEIKVLMLHGLLHLAGYDHETDAGEMQRREESLRAQLGLPPGLIERATSPTLSQKKRKDGARRGPTDGARRLEKRPSVAKAPARNSRVSARDPRTAWVPRSRPDTTRRRKP